MNAPIGIDRRTFLALTGATTLGAAASGSDALAQGTAKRGGTLRVSAQGNPSSLDPMTGNSGSDHVILYTMYDTLVEWDYTTLQAKPGIAESWTYPDPTTLVLTIRDGINFHDGTPCDAAAVRANLVRAMTYERSNIKSDLATVAEVTAAGRNVTLKLKQADSALPLILSDRAGMMCSPTAMEASGRDYDRKPVGAGAWKFVSWADNERVVMARNDHYWKPNRPLLDGVVFQIIPELNTGLRSVTAGQNDFIYFLVPQQKALVSRASNVDSVVGPTMWSIQMYINYGREPMNNVKVRQALNFAVDREEFNKAVMGGLGEPTQTLMPKAHWAYDAEMAKFYTHDPDRARKLLAEAGHPNGLDINGVSYSEQLSVQQQEVLIEQVRKSGIRLRFQRFTGPPTTTAYMADKKGDVFLSAWTGRPDPSLTYQLMFGAGSYYNASRIEGAPGLSDAILATRAASALEARQAAFHKLQRIVTEHALLVPLVFRPEFDAYSKKTKGYQPNLLGKPKFTDVWLEGLTRMLANRPWLRLAGRRLAQIVPVIVLATFIVFGLLKLVPGDVAATLAGEYATDERVAQIRVAYGLDQPFLIQYGRWLWNAVHLDLSRSFLSNEPVLDQILHRFPTTLLLVGCALVIALSVGIPLGVLAATRAGSRLDVVVTGIASFGVALPSFWLAMILVTTFALSLGWFPATGSARLSVDPQAALWYAVLPSMALAASGIAEVVRQLRSALIEILSSQYVRTLYAKGLSPAAILWKHGLKNVAVTLLTVVGLLISRLLGGAVVIESVFAIPGMGSMVVRAAIVKDFPVIQGVVFAMVVLVIAINLIIDILYTIVDPRVALK